MVDVAAKKPAEKQSEKYQGTGRFVGAVGSGITWTAVGTAASIAVATAAGAMTKNLKVAETIAQVGIIVSAVVGTVKGWLNASKGKAQFEGAKAERDNLEIKNAVLSNELEMTKQQVKIYASTMSPRAGSHADAALADKAAAAGAEAAR